MNRYAVPIKRRISRALIAGLLLCGISLSYAQEETEQPAPEETETTSATPAANSSAVPNGNDSLLLEDIPKKELCWLTINQQQSLCLYRKASRGKAKGGVLILPGINQNPASPGIINTLRYTLSENRWHTLAITMPDPASETAADLAQQHIAAGIQHLNTQGVYNIVIIGEGTSASHGMQYINALPPAAEDSFQQIRGLAMINPRNRLPGTDFDLSTAVVKAPVPVLDLFLDKDYRDQREAGLRLQGSRQLPDGHYMQIELPLVGPNWDQQDDRLSKRVRGWLDRRAAGFAVDLQNSSLPLR